MTDEDKKRIVSEPPPPTDEIDGEWGDDDQTLVRELPEGVVKSQPAQPSEAVAKTAVAPISVAAPAVASAPVADAPVAAASAKDETESEEDDDEDDADDADDDEEQDTADDDDGDEDDDDDANDEHASAQHARGGGEASDWIPEWGPFAVLGLLVTAAIVFGLGLVGGASGEHAEEEEASPTPSALAPAAKPSPH